MQVLGGEAVLSLPPKSVETIPGETKDVLQAIQHLILDKAVQQACLMKAASFLLATASLTLPLYGYVPGKPGKMGCQFPAQMCISGIGLSWPQLCLPLGVISWPRRAK